MNFKPTVQFVLTHKCNSNCSYCDLKQEFNKKIYLDIEYIKWILDLIKYDYNVIITGGEIGLINNISVFFKTLLNYGKVDLINIYSNGLFRKRNYDLLKFLETNYNTIYNEHLIKYIIDKQILYNVNNLNFSTEFLSLKNVIVLDETSLNSLVDNFEYFKYNENIINKNIVYKIIIYKEKINGKYILPDKKYIDKYKQFKQKMLEHNINNYSLEEKNKKFIYRLENMNNKKYDVERKICAKFMPNIFLDIENKKIGHCCLYYNESYKVDINEENIKNMFNHNIFSYKNYCKYCYKWNQVNALDLLKDSHKEFSE